ncbi:hypothetical protein [Halopiger thermotolerans]
MHEYREEFGEGMRDVRKVLGKIDPNYEERQDIGELVRFSARASSSDQFSEIETAHLESWITRGQHVLQRSYTMNESLALRNYSSNLRQNPWRARKRGMGIILSLSGIEVREAKIDRSSSKWRETLKSLNGLARGAPTVLTDENLDDHHGITWFIVLNALEALSSIIQGEGHNTEDELDHAAPTSEELQTQFESIVVDHADLLRSGFEHSTGLQVYAYNLAEQEILPISVGKPDEAEVSSNRTQIFHTLGKLRREVEVAASDLPESKPSEKPHLWAIARAWMRANIQEPTGVIPFFLRVNIDSVFQEVWNTKESAIQSVSSNQNDLEEVRSMDDEEIQVKLRSIFSNNTSISPTSRATLSQEVNKSHGGAEISDFDIEIDRGDQNSVFVSFPIKSARETGAKSANKLSEQYLHQILRPFVRFEKCAVFPIIIAAHTLPMNETVKILRNRLDIPIRIIDEELFTQILKHHDEL